MTQAPNILYIHSHDTGRYVRPFGHDLPTPNMQKLAEQGILFRQAFCAAPTCSPSRASLVTGQYPHSNGMLGLTHRGFALYDYGHHITNTLRPAGYYSAAVGVQHIAKRSVQVGYDETMQAPTDRAEDVAPVATAFLRRPPAQPFFLAVGFWETHRVFPTPDPSQNPNYCLPLPTLPDTPAIRQDVASFKTSLMAFDAGVGQVLSWLDESSLADNTLVILTTDHGPAFPGMKCTLTDHGIGVMLILRGPGGFTGGRVSEALVSHIDLYPTICELAGVPVPAWAQGQSIMPLVRGQANEIRERVFAEVNYHAAYEPQRAVRTRRYKYIRRYDGRNTPVPPNTDDSAGKELWMNSGWRTRSIATERLYDLVFDPMEACNVAGDPAYAQALTEMRGHLDQWMRDTNDPLLKGPLPIPRGVIVNDPDQASPNDPTHQIS
jgi:N-sulfoglucosamine sulfohydrolase